MQEAGGLFVIKTAACELAFLQNLHFTVRTKKSTCNLDAVIHVSGCVHFDHRALLWPVFIHFRNPVWEWAAANTRRTEIQSKKISKSMFTLVLFSPSMPHWLPVTLLDLGTLWKHRGCDVWRPRRRVVSSLALIDSSITLHSSHHYCSAASVYSLAFKSWPIFFSFFLCFLPFGKKERKKENRKKARTAPNLTLDVIMEQTRAAEQKGKKKNNKKWSKVAERRIRIRSRRRIRKLAQHKIVSETRYNLWETKGAWVSYFPLLEPKTSG